MPHKIRGQSAISEGDQLVSDAPAFLLSVASRLGCQFLLVPQLSFVRYLFYRRPSGRATDSDVGSPDAGMHPAVRPLNHPRTMLDVRVARFRKVSLMETLDHSATKRIMERSFDCQQEVVGIAGLILCRFRFSGIKVSLLMDKLIPSYSESCSNLKNGDVINTNKPKFLFVRLAVELSELLFAVITNNQQMQQGL